MFKKLEQIFEKGSKYKVFLLTLVVTGLGYGLYKGTIDNYLAEVVGMGELDRGITEFFRELPGLLLVLILAIMYKSSAQSLYRIGAVVMLIGMGMLSIVSPGKIIVIVALSTYSLGEHIQLGMKNTLTLTFAKDKKGGEALGYQNGIYQIGTLAGYAIVIALYALAKEAIPYKYFFLAACVFMTASFLLSTRITGKSETDKTKSRFYFRKKFTKFYMLEVFYGARKQVFFTFGPYVLILFYKADAKVISLLFAVSAISCYFLAPVVGKIIDKIGYKIVMISDTLILVIVCFFYGFAHHIFPKDVAFIVCCVNYVLDSVISLASMASNVYVQDISDSKEEMRATISTGISVNHLITIFIAVFGGWIWQALGIEMLFIVSAVLGLCNSAYAATINVEKEKRKETA